MKERYYEKKKKKNTKIAVPRIRTWVESATTTYTKPLYENGQNHFIYVIIKSKNTKYTNF